MDCPKCGYVMSDFDVECPRCKRLAGIADAAREHAASLPTPSERSETASTQPVHGAVPGEGRDALPTSPVSRRGPSARGAQRDASPSVSPLVGKLILGFLVLLFWVNLGRLIISSGMKWYEEQKTDDGPVGSAFRGAAPPQEAPQQQAPTQNIAAYCWREYTANWPYGSRTTPPPSGWRDVVVEIAVKNQESSRDSMGVYPTDFFVEVNGAQYREDFRASLLIPESIPQLRSAKLVPGGETLGLMAFRVPAGGGISLRWHPGMALADGFQIQAYQNPTINMDL
ncbi:MAG TPA: hypothetical protein DGT21_10295 [Armatimonadetes bacterium]|nr:hypothetical protein [Armatimonadota bacterium]